MKRILIDPTKCYGCKSCAIACMQAHREGEGDVYTLNLSDPVNEERNFIHPDGADGYLPLFCRHCDEPDCVASCMSGALSKNPKTGLVLYDEERCGACFMCVMNCPYGVPKPDRLTGTRIVKCDFCAKNGENPGCVEACPTGAITVEEVGA